VTGSRVWRIIQVIIQGIIQKTSKKVEPRTAMKAVKTWTPTKVSGLYRHISGAYYPVIHPMSSALILVNEQQYAPDGGVAVWIDPMGTVATEARDNAGRRIQSVQNAGSADGQRISGYAYAADGGLLQLILENPTTGQQVTSWAYGTSLATNGVARSDLAVSKTFPTGESATQTYNRQGEVSTMTDLNGSIHAYDRDQLGRLVNDRVSTLAANVDGAVQCISKGYDLQGHLASVTSYASNTPGGSIVNQVALSYNGIDCLTADAQSVTGAVVSGNGRNLSQPDRNLATQGRVLGIPALSVPVGPIGATWVDQDGNYVTQIFNPLAGATSTINTPRPK